MKQKTLDKEILAAAEALFMEKGFDATSTTDIAKKAGCNQALVHYYFRTKDNLFLQIFTEKIELILSSITLEREPESDFKSMIDRFVDTYFTILSQNRELPFFIINDLVMKEERRQVFQKMLLSSESYLKYFKYIDTTVKTEIARGGVRPMSTEGLMLNVASLIIFTFISLPLYSDFFNQNDKEIDAYIERRKEEVKEIIWRGIRA